MDPNTTLESIRFYAERIERNGATYSDAADIVELIRVLDDWMQRGGALPDDWKRERG
jgi:hypothetical protein